MRPEINNASLRPSQHGLRKRRRCNPLPQARRHTIISRKSKFIDLSNKVYRGSRTEDDVRRYAAECRQKRISVATEAESRMQAILLAEGLEFEQEAFIWRRDRNNRIFSFIMVDFLLQKHGLIIECDGGCHLSQRKYDIKRDAWCKREYGLETLRFGNKTILKKPEEVKLKILDATSKD